jgi:hypothetical protein
MIAYSNYAKDEFRSLHVMVANQLFSDQHQMVLGPVRPVLGVLELLG